jgi:hypothetical protein
MDKEIKIAQHQFSRDIGHSLVNYFVLVEFLDDKPVRSYIVEFPESFNYWDDKYPFYCINNN